MIDFCVRPQNNIHFRSLTDSIDTSTPAGRFCFHVMSALADMERELIVERTRAGLAAAREQGRIGRRRRVMTTLEELSPRCEIYSIDEVFCDLTGVRNCRDLADFGREIRETVLRRTHLTVGVGIAQTKTLAKLANHGAKKWQRQTGGVVV